MFLHAKLFSKKVDISKSKKDKIFKFSPLAKKISISSKKYSVSTQFTLLKKKENLFEKVNVMVNGMKKQKKLKFACLP